MKFINDRRRMQGQSGFTLIELLVVIAILGVLAGVVVFAVGGLTNNSEESACKIDKRTIQTAVEAYRTQNPSYPAASDAPDADGDGAPDSNDGLQTLRAVKLLDADSQSKYWVYSVDTNTGDPVYTNVDTHTGSCP